MLQTLAPTICAILELRLSHWDTHILNLPHSSQIQITPFIHQNECTNNPGIILNLCHFRDNHAFSSSFQPTGPSSATSQLRNSSPYSVAPRATRPEAPIVDIVCWLLTLTSKITDIQWQKLKNVQHNANIKISTPNSTRNALSLGGGTCQGSMAMSHQFISSSWCSFIKKNLEGCMDQSTPQGHKLKLQSSRLFQECACCFLGCFEQLNSTISLGCVTHRQLAILMLDKRVTSTRLSQRSSPNQLHHELKTFDL